MLNTLPNSSIHSTLPQRIFQTLSIRYLLALSTIALTILASNWFVTQKLREHGQDSRLLNTANRQGTLLQSMVKNSSLATLTDSHQSDRHRQWLLESLAEWEKGHELLVSVHLQSSPSPENSITTHRLVQSIEPSYNGLKTKFRSILATSQSGYHREHLTDILLLEVNYSRGINQLISQYETEAQLRVSQLISMQQFLMYLSLSIIVIVVLFVFRPVARFIRKSLLILSRSRTQARALATERHLLLQSLNESHKYLTNMHFAVEQATLFAKTDCQGNISHVSPQFRQHLSLPQDFAPSTVTQLLRISSQKVRLTLDQVDQHGVSCQDWLCADYNDQPQWLTVTVVPVKSDRGILIEYLLLCIDISEKKEAFHQLHIANRAKLKQKIREQRMRSVLILQAQEEERKRIAMDLHDNIGQSLTALKYNVEALTSSAIPDNLQSQLDNIGQLLRETIVKVRQTSFHLMPSVLSDYGLAPVLRNFALEMSQVTGKDIRFINQAGFSQRLEEPTEMNLYRIVQESVNNSLKYSHASQILISLSRTSTNLRISVEDNGRGFEPKLLTETKHSRPGRGIGNMEERTKYLQGVFSLESSIGIGTKVIIQIPLTVQKELSYGNSSIG